MRWLLLMLVLLGVSSPAMAADMPAEPLQSVESPITIGPIAPVIRTPVRLRVKPLRGATALLWAGTGVGVGALVTGYFGLVLGGMFGVMGEPTPMHVSLGIAAGMAIAAPLMVFIAGEQSMRVSPEIGQKYSALRLTSLGLLAGAAVLAYIGYTNLAIGFGVGATTPTVVGVVSMLGAVLAFIGSMTTGVLGSALSLYKAKRAHRRRAVVVPWVLPEGGGVALAMRF